MAQKTAYLKHLKGLTFTGKSDSNHWITIDGPEESGGDNAAIRAKELVLIALAGCSSADIVSILKKKKADLKNYEVNISATVRKEHPQIYTDIHLEYVFYGNIKPKDAERAIELSETKYCSINAMLRDTVKITNSFLIVENSI